MVTSLNQIIDPAGPHAFPGQGGDVVAHENGPYVGPARLNAFHPGPMQFDHGGLGFHDQQVRPFSLKPFDKLLLGPSGGDVIRPDHVMAAMLQDCRARSRHHGIDEHGMVKPLELTVLTQQGRTLARGQRWKGDHDFHARLLGAPRGASSGCILREPRGGDNPRRD